jgi:CheY-like chemotaxis protein
MFKILIIDPNDPFRQSLKKVLASRLPFTIIEAVADGDEGLKMVETFDPQLIFLDIHLPTTSGLDVARQIILTSYNSPEYQEAAEDSGVEHLVPKDEWTGEDMIDLVKSILADFDIDEHSHRDQNQPRKHSS